MPVYCAGVQAKPGDIVCADGGGVLVIPIEHAEDVLKFARMQLEDDIKTSGEHYKSSATSPTAR